MECPLNPQLHSRELPPKLEVIWPLCQEIGVFALFNPHNGRQLHEGNVRMIKKLGEMRNGLTDRYRSRIRERAIIQAKARIALSDRDFEDFTENELEIIVQDEEAKVKRSLKQSAVVAVLIALGLS